jgi:hypothetical protein
MEEDTERYPLLVMSACAPARMGWICVVRLSFIFILKNNKILAEKLKY